MGLTSWIFKKIRTPEISAALFFGGKLHDALRYCNKIASLKSKREKGSGTAQIFKKMLGEYVTDLNVVMELGHTEAIKKAMQAGNALGCLSNLTVCGEIDREELKELRLEGIDMKRNLLIIQHKNKVNTKLLDEFLGFCEIMVRCRQEIKCFSSPQKIKVLQEQLKSSG
jgi:hypothetical protein